MTIYIHIYISTVLCILLNMTTVHSSYSSRSTDKICSTERRSVVYIGDDVIMHLISKLFILKILLPMS